MSPRAVPLSDATANKGHKNRGNLTGRPIYGIQRRIVDRYAFEGKVHFSTNVFDHIWYRRDLDVWPHKMYSVLFHQHAKTHAQMITLWIVNRFEKHILRIWNIASVLQWPLTQLAYCQSSECSRLACTQARRRSLHQLRYQLHSMSKAVQQFLTRDRLVHALLDKAVNKEVR